MSDALAQQSGQQYKIYDAVITADHLGDVEYDVTYFIMELSVFEDLEKPYVTGSVAIMDDKAIFSDIGFRGTEKLSLKIAGTGPDISETEFERSFIMKSVDRKVRTTDKTTVYVFSLIDEHAFKDPAIRISKSYKGKIEDIVTKMIVTELGLEVDRSFTAKPSYQAPIKYINPNMTPLNACKLLLDRVTTENGSPFYFYSTLFNDRQIRIGDFDTLYQFQAFNSEVPYNYSAASANDAVEKSEFERQFIVEEFESETLEETLKMTFDGSVGSLFTSQDVYTSAILRRHHDITETLDKLQQEEVIPSSSEQTVYDPEYKFTENEEEDVYLHDLDSRYWHTLTSYGTYKDDNSFHDSFSTGDILVRARNISIRSMLERNKFNIQIPGYGLLAQQISVGDNIQINYLNSDTDDEEENYDKVLSGQYIILKARHLFRNGFHRAILTITKLNTEPSNPSYVVPPQPE